MFDRHSECFFCLDFAGFWAKTPIFYNTCPPFSLEFPPLRFINTKELGDIHRALLGRQQQALEQPIGHRDSAIEKHPTDALPTVHRQLGHVHHGTWPSVSKKMIHLRAVIFLKLRSNFGFCSLALIFRWTVLLLIFCISLRFGEWKWKQNLVVHWRPWFLGHDSWLSYSTLAPSRHSINVCKISSIQS